MNQLIHGELQGEVEMSLREHLFESVHIPGQECIYGIYAVMHMLHKPEVTLNLPVASDISATYNLCASQVGISSLTASSRSAVISDNLPVNIK